MKFYQQHAIYQIYPRSFCDSNGDGIGDIAGIISKLDYLQQLGVGILWLSPVYPSPNHDLGYDVADYTAIHPDYGTMADMDALIAEARSRGMRIVMDLVINHTSNAHPWFQAAAQDVNSPYHDYYIWQRGRGNNRKPPNNWQSVFAGPAWHYVAAVDKWYLHLYGEQQPDLNWHNPAVMAEVQRIMRFWLDKGVYGFRCDVINQIYKSSLADGRPRLYHVGREHYSSQPGCHRILQTLRREVLEPYGAIAIGEAFDVSLNEAQQFFSCEQGNGEQGNAELGNGELDMLLHFEHMFVDKRAIPIVAKPYRPANLINIVKRWQRGLGWNANYLENHDQLRSIERFGDAANCYAQSATVLAMLNLLLRGSSFIYQGQEIGMLNRPVQSLAGVQDIAAITLNETLKKFWLPQSWRLKIVNRFNRDNARTPMQWDNSANAGFSTGEPWLAVNANYESINVAENCRNPHSIWHAYRKLLALKAAHPVLCGGDIEFCERPEFTVANNVLLFQRKSEREEAYWVALNLGARNEQLPVAVNGELLFDNYAHLNLPRIAGYLLPYQGLLWRAEHS